MSDQQIVDIILKNQEDTDHYIKLLQKEVMNALEMITNLDERLTNLERKVG
jgi:hypothetical protein